MITRTTINYTTPTGAGRFSYQTVDQHPRECPPSVSPMALQAMLASLADNTRVTGIDINPIKETP
ncbi:hypothetical protein [Bifidobacterium biavatii]|uniref:Uncharacterized protein n=1 Tax=Bifidobacterium biavatii DSM 23969 TaxID=1437608 RepID=A0A086ZU43_9BIFI|nr:hypothetical protein [Bifidobacterium biavatii]KFI50043.1 hypothetical protein BBIA_2176 [Bifidobacterium biavatii DSM 23969]